MSLPNLNKQELAAWLRKNAVEKVVEEVKIYYSEEEIDFLKEEVVESQKEIRKLYKLKSDFNSLIEGGFESEDDELFKTFDIPETRGMKSLKTIVEQNTDKLNKGFEIEEIELFAVPNDETEEMIYYDIHAVEYTQRKRKLSVKEIHKHVGLFSKSQKAS